MTFAGNWPTNARPVMEKAGHGYVFFFLLYLGFDFDLLMDQSETFYGSSVAARNRALPAGPWGCIRMLIMGNCVSIPFSVSIPF